MSLLVRLPLNGNLNNYGSADVTVTNNGATVSDNGKLGKCYAFNGSSNYLKFSKGYFGSNWSYSIWVYTTSTTSTQTLGCCRTTTGSGFSLFLIGGKLRIDPGGNNVQWTTGYTYPANTWFHLTVTCDNGSIKYYINGEYKETYSTTLVSSQWGNTVSIGSSQQNGSSYGNYLNGRLNDIRIYDHCLSESEIKHLIRGKGLQLWLPLTKDLRQQGLNSATIEEVTNAVFDNSGKLGKCLSGGKIKIPANQVSSIFNNTSMSIAFWYNNNTSETTGSHAICGFSGNNEGDTDSVRIWDFFNYSNPNAFHWSMGTLGNGVLSNIFPANTWVHVCVTWNAPTLKIYIDGILKHTGSGSSNYTFNKSYYISFGYTPQKLNDFRIYDHCLSLMEVKELAKGLVLHYPLNRQGWGQENLLIGTHMDSTDRAGLVYSSSTDWTKYFRYYNGSTSIHSFANGEDTITLNSASNLGISFVRKATDINLDSSSYYTLSCEAKSTQTAKQMCIGLSYYNNSNAWVWRGGTNGQSFTAPNKWQKFTLTFKPDADTQYICYCFTVVGVANGTDTWTIRNCKLEKGSIATSWCPNSSDTLATTMGLNGTTEYDTSGFCNNGTINDATITYSSDTAKYSVSTKNNQAYNSSIYPIKGNLSLSDIEAITIAMWGKPTTNGHQDSGFISTTANSIPTDYQQTVLNHYDSKFACCNASGTVVNLSVGSQFTLNEWHHYVFTYDGTKIYFYKDGVLKTSAAQTGKLKPITSIFPFYSCAGGAHRTTSGYMSDLRIYATALSADDIAELYNGGVL